MTVAPFPQGARLLADVGGTNARFVLETAPLRFEAVAVLACEDYDGLGAAITAYLDSAEARAILAGPVLHAAIAIANPLDGDAVRMMNRHWSFSIAALRKQLNLSTLLVVNDFTALAMALPNLYPSQRIRVGGGVELQGRAIGLVGPGTGLGVSGIVPVANGWVPLATEGGHATYAPETEDEFAIVEQARREYGHVSAERLLSGSGLELICRVLTGKTLSAAEITRRVLDNSCDDSLRAVQCFCGALGSVAGNVALTLGATGGMYIGGGIVPRLGYLFAQSAFRTRFEAKGRLSPYLARIPTYVITDPFPAFAGVSAMLADHITPSDIHGDT